MKKNRFWKKNFDSRKLLNLNSQLESKLDKYFYRKLVKLNKLPRLFFSWLALGLIIIGLLITQTFFLRGYFQKLTFVPGGVYSQGILGTFTTANPIYATSDFDTSISKLIFAGLFTYNSQNDLTPDLASGYQVSASGKVYTVYLKKNLTWQDNQPLTAQDVVFTINTIQNPNAQSPLFSSWQGVTVKALNNLTIQFSLPDPLASFPEQLTLGILPKHLLDNIPIAELRSASFNTNFPIGSGPFKWQSISVSGNSPLNAIIDISLVPFSHYQGGVAKLNGFNLIAYANQQDLVNDFLSGKINSIEGLTNVPSQLKHYANLKIYNFILTSGVYLFFKTSSGILADQEVRSALEQAINVPKIISNLGYLTHQVNEPLLEGQLAYNYKYHQANYNLTNAKNILSSDGWILNKNNLRAKNGQILSFNMVVPGYNAEYMNVAKEIQLDLKQIGVEVNLLELGPTEFNNALNTHQYDSILYGISIGVDPDVFVYWDSSQASVQSSTHLNLSEFSNPIADVALESGRTSLNNQDRINKYANFLSIWQQEVPAVGLYQPRVLYITNGEVYNLDNLTINSSSGILNNVSNWEILKSYVTD